MPETAVQTNILEVGTEFGASGPAEHIAQRSKAVSVRVLRSVAELETLRPFWSRAGGRRDSDLDVYLATLESLGSSVRPHVIVLYRDGQPEAILVGRYEDAILRMHLGYFPIARPRARLLVFVQGSARGALDSGNIALLMHGLKDSLQQGDADLALFHYLDVDSGLYRQAAHADSFLTRDAFPDMDPHWHRILEPGAEPTWQGFNGKHRAHLRKRLKHLAAACGGEIRVRAYNTENDLDALFRDAEVIASKTYQRKLGVGFADTPVRRACCRVFAQKGWLRAYVLFAGDIPCAFVVGTLGDGCFCGDFLGYEPSLRKYSPGSYLLVWALDEMCRQGAREIDFGCGAGEYKERFGTSSRQRAHVFIAAPTCKGVTLNLARAATVAINKLGRHMLQRSRLLPRVRILLRRQAH
jgi:hypothetical protein